MIHSILLIIILGSYTQPDNNILLSLHPLICILLHIKSALMVSFPNFPHNAYLVFPVKLNVMANRATFKKKQIGIIPGFAYTKYKVQRAIFKSATLNLQQKTIKKTPKNYKRFFSIYVQLSKLQILE